MRGVWILLALLLLPAVSAQVILNEFDVAPERITAGDDVRISYRILAGEPLRTVKTDVFLEDAINHLEIETGIRSHEYVFDKTFTIPDSYEGADDMQVKIMTGQAPPIQRQVTFQVIQKPEEEPVRPSRIRDQEPETIHIRFEPIRNIDRGELVHFPITITNSYPSAQDVLIGVEGMTFGTWAVQPGQVVTVPPFGETIAYLAVDVDPQAGLGMHPITLTANYADEDERIDTKVAVLAQEEETSGGLPPWAWGIIIGALVVALAIGIIAWYRNKEEKDEDFITYY